MCGSAFSRGLLWCLATLCCMGCGGGGLKKATGTVSGTVTLKGAPVTSGTVIFFAENDGDTAIGLLQSDGTYTLKYGKSFAVPIGDYRVAITEGPPPGTQSASPEEIMKNPPKANAESKIPAKYRTAKDSGLIAVVEAGKNSGTDFDLK